MALTAEQAKKKFKDTGKPVYGGDGELLVDAKGNLRGALRGAGGGNTSSAPAQQTPLQQEQAALKSRQKGVKSAVGGLFDDPSVAKSANSAYSLYGKIFDPSFQLGQQYNYKIPTPGDGGEGDTLGLLRQQMMESYQRSPQVQNALSLLGQSANRSEFISPELLRAFGTTEGLVTGENTGLAAAQRELLNSGLNQNLQTGLREARGIAGSRGLVGGVEGALAQPALRDYLTQSRLGQLGLQMGNLDAYRGLASDINSQRESARSGAISAYDEALGKRDSFEELRNQARVGAYANLQQKLYDRFFNLGESDRARKDAYRQGELSSIYSGGSVGANRDALDRSMALQEKMLALSSAAATGGGGGGSSEEWQSGPSASSTNTGRTIGTIY